MKTQLESAREGIITHQMKQISRTENIDPISLLDRVARGEIVIPLNPSRPHQEIVGIGYGLRTKVNASIGTSSDICDIDAEIQKAKAAQEEKADTLMELSTGGNLDRVRQEVISAVNIPVGNVPLYQAFKETARKYRNPARMDPEFLFDLIEKQLEDGISFMAIHCGINRFSIERLRKQGFRYGGLASKGGTLVEGPGHVPLDEIEANIILEKRISGNAPYYVLGPIPCDTGAGYDHVTAAISSYFTRFCVNQNTTRFLPRDLAL